MTDLGDGIKGGGRRRGLGRGLSLLIPESTNDAKDNGGDRVLTVPVEFLQPSPFQPRRIFADDALDGLVDSVRAKGVMQPLLVRRVKDQPDRYEIIAGERRWRAAQRAGLHELPAVVHDLSDRDALEVALLENVQRQDLSPLEEAEGYSRLIDEFGHTQQELANVVGKSRSHIANLLRLLTLPPAVRDMVETGVLSAGHARALLNAEAPVDLAKRIVAKGLNVRQAEMLVRLEKASAKSADDTTASSVVGKDADTVALERDLASRLGLKVTLKTKGKGGVLSIAYRSLDQLDSFLNRIR